METFKLSNGMEMPAIGFGCFNAKGGESYDFISTAIDSGYFLIQPPYTGPKRIWEERYVIRVWIEVL